MLYPWRCSKCPAITEVVRSLADIEVPPEKCDACGATEFAYRAILPTPGVKQFILVDGGCRGWHSEQYTRHRSIQ